MDSGTYTKDIVKTIVISLGGSIIVPEDIDTDFIKDFKQLILDYTDRYRFVIITGGGMTCRKYVKAAKKIVDASKEDLDWIGIRSTQQNAELIRVVFGDMAYEKIILNPHDSIESDRRVIVGGGYLPGASSDIDAVIIAKNFGADTLVNLSNIDHVYSQDPKEHPDAEPIEKMSWNDLISIIGEEWNPAMNAPFDPVAAKEAEKAGLKVVIMNGRDIENFRKFISGEDFKGTVIE